MGTLSALLAVAAIAATPVEVSTLSGETLKGELEQISAMSVQLRGEKGPVKISLAEVLGVRFTQDASGQPPVKAGPSQIVLMDGSRFTCDKVTADRDLLVESSVLGSVRVPLQAVSSIRLMPAETALKDVWNGLQKRALKSDLLVIRKKSGLDHLDGFIGTIDEKTVKILLDGDEIPLKRDRVYGVVFSNRTAPRTAAVCRAVLAGGGAVQLKRISWDGNELKASLAAGGDVKLSLDKIRSLDFSAGKVVFLADIEPRDVKYTPYFDHVFKYRRNRNDDGRPLRLGKKVYARGLWIHSKTKLVYRLGQDYRRFRAVMGIDYEVAKRGNGNVHVVIKGDNKTLLEADVTAADKPRDLNLNVSGVRDLEILVDFGSDSIDIADHLDLADARVLK